MPHEEETPPSLSGVAAVRAVQRRIALVVFLLVLTLWAALGFGIWLERQDAYDKATRNAQNLVRVIEAQVHGKLDAADVALLAISRALAHMPGAGVARNSQVQDLLKSVLVSSDPVRAFWVVDAQGTMVYDSDNRPGQFNYAQREYFTQQRDNPDHGLYVGPPIVNDQGVWFVGLSRRFVKPDGSFGGVVVAALEPRYFEKLFATLDIGRHGNLTLLTAKFKLVARQPAADSVRGQTVASKSQLPDLVAQASEGVYRGLSTVDAVDRIFAYRTVQQYPLVVAAGLGVDEALASWRHLSTAVCLVAGLLSAMLAVLGWRVAGEINRSRELQAAVQEAKDRADTALQDLEDVVSAMPDLLFEVDRAGRIYGFRGQRADLLYMPESAFLGRLASEVMPQSVAEVVLQAIGDAAHNGTSAGHTYALELPSGIRWFELSVARKGRPDQSSDRFVLMARDITERVASRAALEESNLQLKQSNADLEQFAYAASHDLLEPLRSVAGSVQLLQKRYQGQLDERADTFIAHAVSGAQRMQALIADLLEFSRLSTKSQAMSLVPLDGVLDTVRKNLDTALVEADARLVVDTLPIVRGDAGQLSHLFQNLLANALKFRGDKPAVVHISAKHEAGYWVFSVADQGIGIAPQHFERIFGIFKRLHTREEYAGNGIGLTLCQRIVERHGGRIWVESVLGQGATFFFSLPDVGPEK